MSNQYNDLLIADIRRETNSETLDAEKNFALSQRVAAGDATAREEMIVGNMPLAITNVESFIRCFPEVSHLRDDLTSAAFLGLTKAVNKMAAGKGPRKTNVTAPVEFMGMWINRELGRLIEEETPIRVPHESSRLAKQQQQQQQEQQQDAQIVPPTVCNVIPERFETPSYQKQLENRDLLESCCTCDEERTLLAMRLAGCTNAAISRAINKSEESARRLGKQLEARIKRKVESLRDE